MKNLGDRMKQYYENRNRHKLIRRIPVIMRADGKAFHTVTIPCKKPFDEILNNTMVATAQFLMSQVQGAKLSYIQSDEISILITDFDKLTTDAWFDYNVQKMCSVAAGYASAYFTTHWCNDGNIAVFDCRVFNIPKEEVNNYFVWRQKDWERNSLQMLAQAHFSHSELHGKGKTDMHEMLYQIGVNWADLDAKWKNGVTIVDNVIDPEIIFTKDRFIDEQYFLPKEE